MLSGQLLEHSTISELLIDIGDDDQEKDPVTNFNEQTNLDSTDIHVDSHGGSNKLYTIVLYLAGQQASGIQALIDIQCVVHSLDLPVVFLEPVIVLNKFKGMPPLQFDISGDPILNNPRPNTVIQFDDLFDLENFNKYASSMNYAQLATRDIFFENAPRKIVFVLFYQGERSDVPELTKLWPRYDTPANDCLDPLTPQLGSDSKYQLYQLVQKGFCVAKVILFRVIGRGQGMIFTETQLRKSILGDMPYSNFTLVFNLWMPKFVLPGVKGLKCISSGYHSAKGQFQPSKKLLANVNYYKKHFLNSTENHLTLMIRLEHVYTFLRQPREEWTVRKCLDAAIAKVKDFQNKGSFGKPFVTLDIGRYGSKTMRWIGRDNLKSDTKYISELLSSVYDGQWSMKEWENSFTQATGGIVDSSYIAALQRTLASKAECLILVGGGMFQELTMRKYMESHNKADWCIHLLCLKNKVNYEIAES